MGAYMLQGSFGWFPLRISNQTTWNLEQSCCINTSFDETSLSICRNTREQKRPSLPEGLSLSGALLAAKAEAP
jgi:hypothetical protein